MFENDRYQTIGIKEHIPLELQLIMWGLIEHAKHQGKELDYLQVFELEEKDSDVGHKKISIKHKQEVPTREANHTVVISEIGAPVSERVYVIDDGNCSTMLLASEY